MLKTAKHRTRTGLLHLTAVAILSLARVSAALADADMVERWWNTLSPEQMVAALHGDQATEAQAMAAKNMYADLDGETGDLVDATTAEIYGADSTA